MSEKAQRWWLAALSLASGAMAAYACTLTSLWGDEEGTALIVMQDSLRGMFRVIKGQDVHPPLFYVALRAWKPLFAWAGQDLALRLFSVACGTGSLWAWHAVFKRLAPGSRAGLGAVWLLAITPLTTWYWTEVRMYAFLLLLTPLAWLSWMKLAQAPVLWRARLKTAFWTVLLPLTHSTMLVGVAAFALWSALEARGKADQGDRLKGSAWTLALSGILYFPHWDTLRYQMDRHVEFWIQRPSWNFSQVLIEHLGIYFIHVENWQGWLPAGLIAFSAAGLFWGLSAAARPVKQILLASFSCMFVLFWVASQLGKPFLIPRVTLPWVPVLFFGVCSAWESWGGRRFLGIMLLIALAVSVPSQVALHLGAGRENSREAVAFVERFAKPGDLLWRASYLGGLYATRAGLLPPEGALPGQGRYWLLRREDESMQGRPDWQRPELYPRKYAVLVKRSFPSSFHPYFGLRVFLVQEKKGRA